jgi:Tfp pilus assembly major pilin PilA
LNKSPKSFLGVTLLEVMLVLAIASMIIVMSVRYYQSANSNQMAISALDLIQGITAHADGIAQASQSYSSVTNSAIQSLMPNQSMILPWGTLANITSQSATQYSVALANTPKDVCVLLKTRLAASAKYTDVDTNACTDIADFHFTYDATK